MNLSNTRNWIWNRWEFPDQKTYAGLHHYLRILHYYILYILSSRSIQRVSTKAPRSNPSIMRNQIKFYNYSKESVLNLSRGVRILCTSFIIHSGDVLYSSSGILTKAGAAWINVVILLFSHKNEPIFTLVQPACNVVSRDVRDQCIPLMKKSPMRSAATRPFLNFFSLSTLCTVFPAGLKDRWLHPAVSAVKILYSKIGWPLGTAICDH